MLYTDAALFRVRRWFENLDPSPGLLRMIVERAGISDRTFRRAMIEGTNPTIDTVRRLERLVPRDFMPLRFDGVMALGHAERSEPETTTVP